MNNPLEEFQVELNKKYPELLSIDKNELVSQPEPFSFLYDLLLKNQERSCKVSVYGNNQELRIIFEWDGCSLFELISANRERLGEILFHWVFKGLMPSEMQILFPELEINEVASYYENGEGIKGEFIVSWKSIERFYEEYYFDDQKSNREDAIRLIQEMRGIGLDEKLRAGQSLWFFMLSRSRRHGLKDEDSYLRIAFLGDNQMVVRCFFEGEEEEEIRSEVRYAGKFKERVEKLLKESIA